MSRYKTQIPACMTREQYKAWKQMCGAWSPVAGPCTDCTPGFQARMKVAGKCDHPEIVFEEDEEGFVYGRKPNRSGK